MADKPRAEVHIDESLVRSLLRAQAPQVADRPLRLVAEGWDNEMWRLGDAHAVRLPRREAAVDLVRHEQRWLTALAPSLPVAVPAPVVAGEPGFGYPWPWSVVEWVEGTALAERPGSIETAETLADFLTALHVPAPADAPVNEYRGVAVTERSTSTERWFALAEPMLDPSEQDRLRQVWTTATQAAAWSGPPVWVHGDLHPLNLVVDGDQLAAVIDFGDLTSGDPASDLAVAWMAFDAPERAHLRAALASVDGATWRRAHGWAASLGVTILANTDDTPEMERVARAIIARVLDGC